MTTNSQIPTIYIIDDDTIMAECIARAISALGKYNIRLFSDAISAMNSIDDEFPNLIFLDILLNGPNGFSLLNELVSYTDTVKIPIVLISSLDLQKADLSEYQILETFSKETMTPSQIQEVVRRVL